MKQIILIIFGVLVMITASLAAQAEVPPGSLGIGGDSRESYTCGGCATSTESCTRQESDPCSTDSLGRTSCTHINAICTLNWGSADFDFSLVAIEAINNNIGKVSDEALRKNLYKISDLAGLTSKEAKEKLSKTFKEKYGIEFAISDAYGKVTISEEGILESNGIRVYTQTLKGIDSLMGIEVYTIADSQGNIQNGVWYKYGKNGQIFDLVGTFKSVKADDDGNMIVDGFKVKFSENSGRLGIKNGAISLTNGYFFSGKDEVYGYANFFVNSDGSIDRKQPVTMIGQKTWACFDGKSKCGHNDPGFDLLTGVGIEGKNKFDDSSKIPKTVICIECPKSMLEQLRAEAGSNEIQGFAFYGKEMNTHGKLADALELRGHLLSTFKNNLLEGKDNNMQYKIVDDGENVDVEFEFLGSYSQNSDGKVGRAIAYGKSLELFFENDGTVHVKDFNLNTPIPVGSVSFLKNSIFNNLELSPSDIYNQIPYASGGKLILEMPASMPNQQIMSYLKGRFPNANDREILLEYAKLSSLGKKKYEFIGKIEKEMVDEKNAIGESDYSDMKNAFSDIASPTVLHHISKRKSNDGLEIEVENFYAISREGIITNQNYVDYPGLLKRQYERDLWSKYSQDTSFQYLSEAEKQKKIESEMFYKEPLVYVKANINRLRNLLDAIKGSGNVYLIKDLKETIAKYSEGKFLVDNEADAWEQLKYYQTVQTGMNEIDTLRANGKSLTEIKETSYSDSVRLALETEPNLKFVYDMERLEQASKTGGAIEIDGISYDTSSSEQAYAALVRNYVDAVKSNTVRQDYALSNMYLMSMMSLTMGEEDFKTAENAIKKNPNVFGRFISSSFGGGTLMQGSTFVKGEYTYVISNELGNLYREGKISEDVLAAYIDNKAEIDWQKSAFNKNPGQIANAILPSSYFDLAMMVTPSTKGAGTVVSIGGKQFLKSSATFVANKMAGQYVKSIAGVNFVKVGGESILRLSLPSGTSGLKTAIKTAFKLSNPKPPYLTAKKGEVKSS